MDFSSKCWCLMKAIGEYHGVGRDVVLACMKTKNNIVANSEHIWKFKANKEFFWIKSVVATKQ